MLILCPPVGVRHQHQRHRQVQQLPLRLRLLRQVRQADAYAHVRGGLHDGDWRWDDNPGGSDIQNHCDDCATLVNLPFPVNVYGAPISLAYAGSNGTLQFSATPNLKPFYFGQCVPVTQARAVRS